MSTAGTWNIIHFSLREYWEETLEPSADATKTAATFLKYACF